MQTTVHDTHAAQDSHAAEAHHEHHEELSFWRKYIFATDHKMIGLQYLFTGLIFLFFGFCLMLLMRWQLAYPGKQVPIIGNLFKATQKSTLRSELIILIRPTVIESDEDLARTSKHETYRTVVGGETEIMAEPSPVSVPRPVDETDRPKKE